MSKHYGKHGGSGNKKSVRAGTGVRMGANKTKKVGAGKGVRSGKNRATSVKPRVPR